MILTRRMMTQFLSLLISSMDNVLSKYRFSVTNSKEGVFGLSAQSPLNWILLFELIIKNKLISWETTQNFLEGGE